MTVAVGSLCSGYGGLEMGLAALLDVDHAWHAEVDPDMSTVLAKHWPGVPNLGDITAANWSTVPPVDILAGGVPCQPFSNAGKRLGSLDERDLWPVRKFDAEGNPRRGAVDAIRDLRPAMFILENVASLVTAEQGAAWSQILADLYDLGYIVSWTTVGACKVGTCHHRHRVFLAAIRAELVPDDVRPPSAPSWCRTAGRWDEYGAMLAGAGLVTWPAAGILVDGHVWPQPSDICGAPAVRPARPVSDDQGDLFAVEPDRPSPVLDPAGVVTMLPTPTARIADGRGTPSAETAAHRIHEEGRRNLEDAVALLPTPTARDGMSGPGHAVNAEGSPDLRTVVSLLPTPTARDAERGAGWGDQPGRPLSEVVALLPTPMATDADGGPGRRNTHGKPLLPGAVTMLPTPCSSDANKDGPGACGSKGEPQLPGAVHLMSPSEARGVGSSTPTPRASDGDKGGPNQRGSSGDLALPAAVQPGRFGVYEAAVRRQEAAFGIPAPEPTEPGRLGKPRLAPAFPEWMQGLPSGWLTDHVDRKAAIKGAGNGVMPQQCAYALMLLPTFRAFLATLNREAVAA